LSVSLGKIMGIPIRIHYTLWLVFILISWSLAYGYMPSEYPGLSTITYWAIGIASAIVLFVSILVHELSHSYVAKKNGLPIARITLFFFGGVSEMTEEPQNPRLEVRMAAAGPLVSFLISGVLAASWYVGTLVRAPVPIIATLGYAALINAILGTFNLIPAFPLDGGRVFRGSLWGHSKNLIAATRTATRVSEALSLLMMLGGFGLIIIGQFVNGLWVIVLGWFIRSGAETSLRQTVVSEVMAGVKVADIMTGNVLTVLPEFTVQQLISDYFLVHHYDAYPVVKNGQVLGLVTLQGIRSVPKEQRDTTTVQQAMISCQPGVIVDPSASAMEAMRKMGSSNVSRILVVDQGRLVGVVTREDVVRAIQTRQELGLVPSRGYSGVPSPQVPPIQAAHCVQCGALLQIQTRFCPHCGARQFP
jgi:Zn-dependent protease/predicted transcriptional regulator